MNNVTYKKILSRLLMITFFINGIVLTLFLVYSCSTITSNKTINDILNKTFKSQDQNVTLLINSIDDATLNNEKYELKKQSNDVFTLYNQTSIENGIYHDFIIVSADTIYYETENIYLIYE